MRAPWTLQTPYIEGLRVRNYRVLRDVRLRDLSTLTVLIGHNGSGKSTLIDALAFLSECFNDGLPAAWARRGGLSELRSRGQSGPVVIELKYREHSAEPLITYRLELDEQDGAPVVAEERMEWRNGRARGGPLRFLCYRLGEGYAVAGDQPDDLEARTERALTSPDLLAADILGQLSDYPCAVTLRRFVKAWYFPAFTPEALSAVAPRDEGRRLSRSGDNLAAVIHELERSDPARLAEIVKRLQRFIPQLEQVTTCESADNRVRLQIKDRAFEQPFFAERWSEGALRILAQLVLFHDPEPPPLIAIDEPEIAIHPHRLQEHGESLMLGSERSQLIAATQAPTLLDSMRPRDVQFLHRGLDGFTIARAASELRGVPEYLEVGGQLGDMWQIGMLEPPSSAADPR